MQPAPENPLNQTPFEALGGEDRVRALTDAFYDRMDQDPAVAPIRRMHPEDLTESRQKLFEFLHLPALLLAWLDRDPAC